jgi:hypothetical protein
MRRAAAVSNLQSDTKTTDEELNAFDVQHAQFTKQLSMVRLIHAHVRRTRRQSFRSLTRQRVCLRLLAAPRSLRQIVTRSAVSGSSSIATRIRGQPRCCIVVCCVVCCIGVICACEAGRSECFLGAPATRQAGAAAASYKSARRGRRLAAPHTWHAGERG